MKRKVLCVDDQPENLIVFRASFGRNFEILEASSAAEALELFKKHEIPVLVADQRMPDMTGVELCEVVSREYPHTVRMILTGYIDTEAMTDAINKGHVYNFITKPWQQQTLLSVLMRGFEAYDQSVRNSALLERLDHAGRCATLGWFAAGVAHEMKNQLFVLPLVELLEEKYQGDQELMELSRIARQTHDRLDELISEVLNFVRRDNEPASLLPANLADIAREAVSLACMDDLIPRKCITLEAESEPVVRCHRAKIQQVLFNLLRNAADATRNQDSPQIHVAIRKDQSHALLSVSDNGPGIPPDVLPRIWEPFFTTKGDGGNGLGLDICRRIIDSHNGSLSCTSTPGEGAAFVIQLQCSEILEVV